jgi:shikimate kinase
MTPAQLTHRLLESAGDRPLIKNIPNDQLPGFIENKLSQRENWYKRANIIIEGINLDINILQSAIINYPEQSLQSL